MAQKKISELPLTKTLNADDIFPLVQSGVTKQISYSDLKEPMVEEVTTAVKNDVDDVRYDKYSNTRTDTGIWNDGENSWTIERRIVRKKRLRNIYQLLQGGTLFNYIYIANADLRSDNNTKGKIQYSGNGYIGTDDDDNNGVSHHYSEALIPFFLRATAIMTNGSKYELQTLKTGIFSNLLDWWVFTGANYDDIQYLIIENVWGN